MANAIDVLKVVAKKGKVKLGTNEVTKCIERGTAKLVVYAEDVQPKEIVMHLTPLCKEKKIPITQVKTKKELGEACGVTVGAASCAVIDEGEAKKEFDELIKQLTGKKE